MKRITQSLLSLTVLFSVLLLSSCDKEDASMIHISGNVTDPGLAAAVNGATVTLLSQKIIDGTWSANYSKEAETTSDANGDFKFDLEFNYNPAFKIEISKTDYFEIEYEIPPADFVDGTDFTQDFELASKGYIRLSIVNIMPVDENDEIKIRFVDWAGQGDACFAGFFEFTGMEVNEVYECALPGGQDYQLEYIVSKTGFTSIPTITTVSLPSFQITNVNLNY